MQILRELYVLNVYFFFPVLNSRNGVLHMMKYPEIVFLKWQSGLHLMRRNIVIKIIWSACIPGNTRPFINVIGIVIHL